MSATEAVVEVTSQTFREVAERSGIVLFDWWAPWCGPCRSFGPIYAKVAARHPDVVFGKVNTEIETDLAASIDIRSIPTLMVLRDGVLLFSQAAPCQRPHLRTSSGWPGTSTWRRSAPSSRQRRRVARPQKSETTWSLAAVVGRSWMSGRAPAGQDFYAA